MNLWNHCTLNWACLMVISGAQACGPVDEEACWAVAWDSVSTAGCVLGLESSSRILVLPKNWATYKLVSKSRMHAQVSPKPRFDPTGHLCLPYCRLKHNWLGPQDCCLSRRKGISAELGPAKSSGRGVWKCQTRYFSLILLPGAELIQKGSYDEGPDQK